MNRQICVAQIGCGYWGPNLLRNLSSLPDCRVKYVVDNSAERRHYVETNFPRTKGVLDLAQVLEDKEVDAVVIATPACSHFSLACSALEHKKHVLVEKPLATKVSEVDQLATIAARQNRILMVGHTFIYNSAVRYVKSLIDSGEIGEVRYAYSQRLNLGRIRSDIDALWNFAPHDVSIIQYWLSDPQPLRVLRHGMAFIQEGIDDVVFLNITYPAKVMANIHVSWLDPQKTRKVVVVGSRKMVVYDDTSDDKVAVYDKGIDQKAVLGEAMDYDRPQIQFSYRAGNILLPSIRQEEPLRAEVCHFLDCIRSGQTPITGVSHARNVVAILEQAKDPSQFLS